MQEISALFISPNCFTQGIIYLFPMLVETVWKILPLIVTSSSGSKVYQKMERLSLIFFVVAISVSYVVIEFSLEEEDVPVPPNATSKIQYTHQVDHDRKCVDLREDLIEANHHKLGSTTEILTSAHAIDSNALRSMPIVIKISSVIPSKYAGKIFTWTNLWK